LKFTQDTINGLTPPTGKDERIVFDDDLPGLGARIRSSGSRTWVYQYKIGAQHRRITLGTIAALSLQQVRKAAGELQAKVRLGRDPASEKAEAQARAAETMGALLKPYLELKRTKLKSGSLIGVERHLRKHSRRLHKIPLVHIDRRAIAAVLSFVASNSGPTEANRVRASLSAFFSWCIGEGLLDHNPVAHTVRRDEASRERVLDDHELKAIWAATAGDDDYSSVVRLLMLTGARANEIAALRRTEVLEDRITITGGRTKNARPHTIATSEVVRAILADRLRRHTDEFVFGRRRGRPLSGWSVLKTSLDERIAKFGVTLTHWTHHDLRRTLATKLAEELNIEPHIIEALLGHVSGHKRGVAGVYNRADYFAQKRQALGLWADHLLAIVEGRAAKVTPLRGAK
jgi:integrase